MCTLTSRSCCSYQTLPCRIHWAFPLIRGGSPPIQVRRGPYLRVIIAVVNMKYIYVLGCTAVTRPPSSEPMTNVAPCTLALPRQTVPLVLLYQTVPLAPCCPTVCNIRLYRLHPSHEMHPPMGRAHRGRGAATPPSHAADGSRPTARAQHGWGERHAGWCGRALHERVM